MDTTDIRYLKLMAREYPDAQATCAEIINLNAILNLPKGTEHFMSDIHGEHEAFLHILNNASGAVFEKIEEVFGNSLTKAEAHALAGIIYYPKEKLLEAKATRNDLDDWYRVTLHRLVQVCRVTASKYSRSKVRKALPKDFAYIMEELMNTHALQNKEKYYENIIRAIIDTGSADTLIYELAELIKRMAVDMLHIVGDIFDRGPHADVILDRLMRHHSVDIQWGNHDVLWMGAGSGSQVCVATAVRNCVQYDNLDMLENAYGINLLPLALFATDHYDNADVFEPRKLPDELFKPRDASLYSRMHKAISVIQFKLEGQLIKRHPEYHMDDRDMFSRVDWEHGTIEINGVTHELRDKDFPTVFPSEPNVLTEEELALMEQLTNSFMNSEKLQAHMQFLFSQGSVYRRCNGNLLYHGCIPCESDGSFMEMSFGGGPKLSGRALLDQVDKVARQGFFAPLGSKEREDGCDFLWYLWCGRNSPIFGREQITTFERALLADKDTWKEPKNAYYKYYNDEAFCLNILAEFGLHKPWSRIVNGHIPVKVKEGEDPRKANGRLVVIDGGFCRAYQKQTGIAGYTMFFSSRGIRIASHEPFTSLDDAINNDHDITSHSFIVENHSRRLMIRDTDVGEELTQRIDGLKALLDAYRNGTLKPTKANKK